MEMIMSPNLGKHSGNMHPVLGSRSGNLALTVHKCEHNLNTMKAP